MHIRHASTAAPRALAIGIALIGALVLHACGGDSSASPVNEGTVAPGAASGSARVASPAANSARPVACALVGSDDAAAVLGEPVEAGEAEQDSRGTRTGCNYISKGSVGSRVVYIQVAKGSGEKAVFDLAKRAYSNPETLQGLGDEAFVIRLDAPVVQVHVRKGDAYYILAVTSPDEAARGARTLELARKVAAKL